MPFQTLPERSYYLFDHFLTFQGDYSWTATEGGGGNVGSSPTEADKVGVLVFNQGTATPAYAILRGSTGGILLGTNQWSFTALARVIVPADATNDYIWNMGLGDTLNESESVDGVFFEYNRAVGGDYWACVTVDNSTKTRTITAVPVTLNQWERFRWTYNPKAGEVRFWINDVLVAVHTSNIPTARATGLSCNIRKTAGTGGGNSVQMDFLLHEILLSTSSF